MALRIDPDHRRFRDIVRGKIKQDLRKYISQGELIGRKGKDMVSIPLPQIDIPHFRFGSKDKGGVGQGQGEVGDTLGKGDPGEDGPGKAGDQAGRARARGRAVARGAGADPGRGAAAAEHRAQGQAAHHQPEGPLRRHPAHRARVAAPLPPHVPPGAAPPDHDRHVQREGAADRPGARGQALPVVEDRAAAAVERGHHLHDGRVGLDGRRAEGDRPHRVVLDRYLAALAVQRARDALHHPRRGRQGGRPRHVLQDARVGRHDDLQRVQAVREDDRERFPALGVEHLPVSLLRRRQLVGRRHRPVHRASEEPDPAAR